MTKATRSQQREAMYTEIVRVSQQLLADGELSLRAVAQRMGITPPALYRYVSNYQQLVDLVAYEIDREATEGIQRSAERYPEDDPIARLVAACVAWRAWALENPRLFGLAFANPAAHEECDRRELMTHARSGTYFTDLLYEVWLKYQFSYPAMEEFSPEVREALRDPIIPANLDNIAESERGLVWLYMQTWASLYGVVTLEALGHLDPRIIASGEMFVAAMSVWFGPLNLGDDAQRAREIFDFELRRKRGAALPEAREEPRDPDGYEL